MKYRAAVLDSPTLVIKPAARKWDKFKANVAEAMAEAKAAAKAKLKEPKKRKGDDSDKQPKIAKFFSAI